MASKDHGLLVLVFWAWLGRCLQWQRRCRIEV